MKTKISIVILIIALSQLLIFCGKTDTDIQWTDEIQAYWVPMGTDYSPVLDMPSYKFDANNRGASYFSTVNDVDSFSWEIKRAQLKIYYDKAPTAYYIGYDKYNSRSLFKIKYINDTALKVIQFFGTGYQKEYYMLKSKAPDAVDDESEF